MLRVDLHIHTSFSPDSLIGLQGLVRRCLETGLTCIAVTDHNTIQGALALSRTAPFKVIVGEEIKTSGGELVGLFLKEEVPRGLTPLETIRRVKEQGGLVSIPHPFDVLRRSVIRRDALEEVLPLIDIIEVFNARNIFRASNSRAMQLAEVRGLVKAAVSDAHSTRELGRTYMEMPDLEIDPALFKAALAEARLVTRPSGALAHFLSTYAKLRAKLNGRRGG
ncbi:MAG: PHP domain-containing protein [Chloroflexi bacterium]|nr:PHP domain-containing protein [Chloroflexota bacterium]